MSTLSSPRIIVFGTVSWNPNTVNNSEDSYDEVNVEPQLGSMSLDQYKQWLFQMSSDSSNPNLNGGWNVFGDYTVLFQATVTGAPLPLGIPNPNDPLINQPVTLGIPSGSPPVFARMVDIDPFSPYTTQIFYPTLSIGNSNVGVSGTGKCRMISRWLNTSRNLGVDPGIGHAGRMGAIWQVTLPASSLSWGKENTSSGVLLALRALVENPLIANQGLVFLFTTYCTQYFQSTTWKEKSQSITNIEELGSAYQAGFQGGNPAVSTLLGRVGIWGPGEMASAPTDILLAPENSVAPASAPSVASRPLSREHRSMLAQATQGIQLGPAQARVDSTLRKVVLDLLVTFPENDATLAKADLGTFTLQVVSADGSKTPIGTLAYDQYDQQQYESNGGIVEFPFPGEPGLANVIANGELQLVSSSGTVVLKQCPLVSEADERGIWVDEGTTATITVTTYQNGATPPQEAVQLLVVPYVASTTVLGFDQIMDASEANFELLDGNGNPLPLSQPLAVGPDGTTKIAVRPLKPGIGTYFLFPFTGSIPPTPPAVISPVGPEDFFIVLRALSFDNALLQDTPLTWQNVYQKVLSTWDVVYPAMSTIIPLSNEQVVEQKWAGAIIQRVSKEDPLQSPLYMPISRDMSAGRKALLVSYLQPFVPKTNGE